MKRGLGLFALWLLAQPGLAKPPSQTSWPDSVEVPVSTTLRTYRDWRIEQSAVLISAVTTNQDGSSFGLLCGKACTYYANTGTRCDTGATYPGLLSTQAGAIPITLRCTHVREEGEDYSVLIIDDDLTDALNDATQVNLVIPLEEGEFAVSHFSMAGAAEALDAMLEIAMKQDGAKRKSL